MSRFNFKPISNWILVRKCLATNMEIDEHGAKVYSKGGVTVPDNFGERTPFAQVLDVGPQCKEIGREHCDGSWAVMCPEWGSDIRRVQGEDFVVRESGLRTKALFKLG